MILDLDRDFNDIGRRGWTPMCYGKPPTMSDRFKWEIVWLKRWSLVRMRWVFFMTWCVVWLILIEINSGVNCEKYKTFVVSFVNFWKILVMILFFKFSKSSFRSYRKYIISHLKYHLIFCMLPHLACALMTY